MRLPLFFTAFVLASPFSMAEDINIPTTEALPLIWQQGSNVEEFWTNYANSKGGITFGRSSTFPEYDSVKEGNTLLIELKQGPCLMEFFHNRWRRANDVRRWDNSINSYGGCPYVFD